MLLKALNDLQDREELWGAEAEVEVRDLNFGAKLRVHLRRDLIIDDDNRDAHRVDHVEGRFHP